MPLPVLHTGQEFIALVNLGAMFDGDASDVDVSGAVLITFTIVDSAGADLFAPVAQSSSDTDIIAGSSDWSKGALIVRVPGASTALIAEQFAEAVIDVDGQKYKTGGSIWIKK